MIREVFFYQFNSIQLCLTTLKPFFSLAEIIIKVIMHLNVTITASGHIGFFSAGSIIAKESETVWWCKEKMEW